MVEYYCYCCNHFLDDSAIISEVFSDKIYFQYPVKSGQNGADFLLETMNFRYKYDPYGKLEVLSEVSISNKKMLELVFCNATTHVPLDYVLKKERYG